MVTGTRLRAIRWEYETQGVALVRGLVPAGTVQKLLAETRRLSLDPPVYWKDQSASDDPGRFVVGAFLWRISAAIREVALESPVSDLAAGLLDVTAPRLFYDQVFMKTAGATTPTRWHRDLPFWPFLGDAIPSFWIALTKADATSSAVVYWPGTHRLQAGVTPAPVAEQPPDPTNQGRAGSVSFDLQPGDVVIHHPMIIHGAGGNASGYDRVALSVRYLGRDVRWSANPHRMFVPGASGKLVDGDRPALDEIFPPVSLRGRLYVPQSQHA